MRKKERGRKQEQDQLSSRVVSSLLWKFSERILAQVISFIVSIVLARMLFPDDYGVVAIVTIFISFADVLATSGFSSALIQKKDADELDFSSVFYCSLVISILAYVALFFAAPLIASFYNMPIVTLVIRVFSLRIPLAAFNSVQHAYVSRHMMFKKFFFSTLFGTLFSAGLGIFMALKGFGVWALVAQYMSNSIIDSIVLLFTVKWRPRLMFSWERARGLLKYG
jgi:O-antigen/teichoic acid export membrane protein